MGNFMKHTICIVILLITCLTSVALSAENDAHGKSFSIGAGFGNYKGENSVAIGGKGAFGKEKNLSMSFGVSIGGKSATTGAGIGWSF